MIASHTSDVSIVQRTHALPAILKALASLTGLRLVALVRVTESDWMPCAVLDGIGTGIQPGEIWHADGTACRLVRDRQEPVALSNAQAHVMAAPSSFATRFGIQAYFGYPVYRADGTFFGALCAMDTRSGLPAVPGLVDTAKAFCEVIGSYLGENDGQAGAPDDGAFHVGRQAPVRDAVSSTDTAVATAGSGASRAGNASGGRGPSGPAGLRVLSVLAHDLRNPMHSLLAALEMLRTKPLEPRAERLVGMVQASAVRLSELAQQTMDYARSQIAGDVPMHLTPDVDLRQPVERAAEDVARAYPQRRLEVDLVDLPKVQADVPRIVQAMAAVLVHAVKHVGAESAVTLVGRQQGEQLMLTVEVPGYIVPPELQPHMFDPFHEADGEPQTAQFGVGLYLSHWIAQAHGGSMTLDVSDDDTARFTLLLPASR